MSCRKVKSLPRVPAHSRTLAACALLWHDAALPLGHAAIEVALRHLHLH
jgi:hypothetical protein